MTHRSPQTLAANFTSAVPANRATQRSASLTSCLFQARTWIVVALLLALATWACAQTVTSSIQGRVYDTSGAALPQASVTAVNTDTGVSRQVNASPSGDYQIEQLPPGDYTVTAEKSGFQKSAKKVHLALGAAGNVDFSLPVGQVTQEVEVQDVGEVAEPTRTMVSSVIDEQKIQDLPVNGRQFIDFALLAPGVTIGDTTSGSTDVIIEPVTKLSFAGQNIHYNFVAIDGADNMSTASGIQKTTPSQEAVREFRVINSSYSTEFGRAVGGIVNIITKSGTNQFHGSVYDYFRNDAMDAQSILASPDLPTCNTPGDPSSGGCQFLKKLHQNQYGFTVGGPIKKDQTFFFGNYEGQRRSENPFYNSAILGNINLINQLKCTNFGSLACGAAGSLPTENLAVTRDSNYDNFLVRLDHQINKSHSLFVRYFFNDERLTQVSPLNDGFDLPSGYKQNSFRDQTVSANLSSTLSSSVVNELRFQYAHRFFDFPTNTTQPHLEVTNIFTVGVNRGNPDMYAEHRSELVDDVTWVKGRHSIQFGGDVNFVSTTESFPLFYPFEADFGCLQNCVFSFGNSVIPGLEGAPNVIFFERFDAASNFTEPSIDPAVYQGEHISSSVRNQAKGTLDHTYNGLFIQDKWRTTDRLTLNYGLRWESETWPSRAVNNVTKNFDPRVGFSYGFGGSRNFILRGGAGLFHGMIPSPLLMCQEPSCGGTIGPYPGRENKEDSLNARTRLFAFAAGPFSMNEALTTLLNQGTYPDAVPVPGGICPEGTPSSNGFLSGCGFFGDSVIVRFAKDHKPPYGVQASLGLEFQPVKDTVLDISYLHVRGVHLGSFWNVNQPPPNGCPQTVHNSKGQVGLKDDYHVVFVPGNCSTISSFPGTGQPTVAVYFEADSKWDSVWDGLLVNFNKRVSHHVGFGLSYTYSKGIDNGPNPSFVLIPQDSRHFDRERAVSADHTPHRFVANAIFTGPTRTNFLVNNWELSTIVTLETPHYFTKFAGFDANGDVFGNNDRVGIEPRNTFKGDSYQNIDLRVSRDFPVTERFHIQGIAEAFNLFNTVNVRFYNTVYGAADFCPLDPTAPGCPTSPSGFREGSPNPSYGTPRAVFNPRQIQFALRLTW
jgi:Carboxypeptidase regulatory-like domain